MFDNRISKIAIIGLIALYVAVRLWHLTNSCLWFDEIFSVHAAENDWSSLFEFVAKDLIHPPLFYVVLKVWIAIGGESLLWLRLLPVTFAVLSLVPFLLLCRELKQKSDCFACGFLACGKRFVDQLYTASADVHAVGVPFAILNLVVCYFNRGKSLVSLLIVNLFLIYTHYYGLLVVGCEIGAILLLQRIKWRGAAAMSATAAVAFLPWLYAILTARRNGSDVSQNIAWIAKPGFKDIGMFIIDLLEPFYFQFSSTEPTSIYAVSLPLLLIFAAAIAMFLFNFRKIEAAEKQTYLFLAIFAIAPILVVLIASWVLPYSVWGSRHLIICAGPLALLMANVVTRIEPKSVRISAISLIVLFSLWAFVLQAMRAHTVYLWCEWDRIGNEFASDVPKDPLEKIYAFESLIAYHVWFATRNSANAQVFDVEGFDPMKENEVYFLPRGFDGVQKAKLEDITGDRAWLLFRTHKVGEEVPLIESLRSRGYSVCETTSARYGLTNVFKIEIVKPPSTCSE